MAKLSLRNGITGLILRVKILDTSVTTGAGLTGLTNGSSGLRISTIADNESAATSYTSGGGTIDTITTLGTFAAPSSGHCRFKEVDGANHPGLYEIQIADARWAVSSARSVVVTVTGAANAAQVDAEIQLQGVPTDLALAVPTSNTAQTVGDALNAARAQGFGKWALNTGTNTLTLYASDGTTVVRTFTLDSSSAPTTRT